MSKLQLLHVFLNERLTAAAVEIFGAVEKTVVEYQEENYLYLSIITGLSQRLFRNSVRVPSSKHPSTWECCDVFTGSQTTVTNRRRQYGSKTERGFVFCMWTVATVLSSWIKPYHRQRGLVIIIFAILVEYSPLSRLKMSTLQMLRVFLNERLTAAAVEIFGAVEKTVAEYQEENDRLRSLLRIIPDKKLCRKVYLFPLLLVCTKDCLENLSVYLLVNIHPHGGAVMCLRAHKRLLLTEEFNTEVKLREAATVLSSWIKPYHRQKGLVISIFAILVEYSPLSRLKMSTLQMLRVFLNERLTAAAVEIFGAVEKTVVEYQEENDRLRSLLRITQDIKLCRKEDNAEVKLDFLVCFVC
ncbi:unnamed protein product [Coregonus sp. 'balchen']|nr:unnamed protein product [Coregonus sp. 'balchen']